MLVLFVGEGGDDDGADMGVVLLKTTDIPEPSETSL